MGQVTGNIAEVKVLWADQLYRGTFEHPESRTSQKPWHGGEVEKKLPVMFFAYVSRVLDRFLDDVVNVLIIGCQSPRSRDDDPCTYRFRADDSNVVGVRFEGVQRDVYNEEISSELPIDNPLSEFERTLSKQETNSDPRQIEPIKPSLDFIVYLACVVCSLPLEYALRDGGHSGVVSPLDVFQKFCELGIVIPDFWWPNYPRGLGIIPAKMCASV